MNSLKSRVIPSCKDTNPKLWHQFKVQFNRAFGFNPSEEYYDEQFVVNMGNLHRWMTPKRGG